VCSSLARHSAKVPRKVYYKFLAKYKIPLSIVLLLPFIKRHLPRANMPLMRTTSSRRASKRFTKKRTNPKRKYTNTFKRLTKKQYYNISTRNPNISYLNELRLLA
jgi:hypothetical protein